MPSSESTELRAARRRIRELETELAIVRQAATFLGEDRTPPKRLYPVIDRLVDAGAFISGVLGRKPVSRVSNALLAKRAHA